VRPLDHRARLRNTAALLQFHVDAVARFGQAVDIRDAHGGLVRDDRQLAVLADASQTGNVPGGGRLLHELDAVADEAGDARRRFLGRPCRVRIHAIVPRNALGSR